MARNRESIQQNSAQAPRSLGMHSWYFLAQQTQNMTELPWSLRSLQYLHRLGLQQEGLWNTQDLGCQFGPLS